MSVSGGVNDFVVRFANVNGTGSASANTMFAKAIFRMGVPVSAKNIFPSNIQGLPTWYEVRVNGDGYIGRREGINLMVSVNPQSIEQDLKNTMAGGYFMYDSTWPLPHDKRREDLNYLEIPLMEMSNKHFSEPRLRQLFKNIIYVGACSALLNIDRDVIIGLLNDQFPGKEKVVASNVKALDLGIEYAREHWNCPLSFHASPLDLTKGKIMVDGNTACGLGAVYGGATVMAWYPITPSTSVADAFEQYCSELRVDKETGKHKYAIIQAEDELAAIGVVIGANWNGARAFTATSGPGVSLMNEFLGLAYFAEIPTVLIDVQRTGPSTGMPTRTQQSDIMLAFYASHGDTKHVLLFPSTPTECFEMTATALDLAERLQTPIMVMTDLDLGMNDHLCDPFTWDTTRMYDRGKVLNADDLDRIEKFGRYLDVDKDGITYRTLPGTHPTKGSFFTRGTSRDEFARYTEEGAAYVRNMDRLIRKFDTAKTLVPPPQFYPDPSGADVGMLFFGTTTDSALEAIDMLRAQGIQVDGMRLKAAPFPQSVLDFIMDHETVFVVEQNRDAQMRSILINELEIDPRRLVSVLNYDGFPITADFIIRKIHSHIPQPQNAV
ncbi:MAG: 2-oxoacid:acceptor oxidoreductase subunit alpha [Saprospiraceae bacterium]|nr:2-oxoacid:acceptor oxidoreductase subunit alpha [Candidatus Opimibacter skivensis]